jgi:methanethiol S-methyltransferase
MWIRPEPIGLAGPLTALQKENPLNRIFAFLYGVVCYLIFFCTFLYAIGFVSNVLVPTSIDSKPTAPLGQALLINAGLLGLFAVQHSVMARQGFKKVWTKIVPAAVERSTYVLFASLALIFLFWRWEPIGGVVWNVQAPDARVALQVLSLVGFGIVLISTFLINHFDLFGLRQVFLYLKGQPYTPLGFRTPVFYKYVRHPIYLGFIIAFWATPTMTIAHLVFALATTGYILIAIQLEERDLVDAYGKRYEAYRDQVSMLMPRPPKKAGLEVDPSAH